MLYDRWRQVARERAGELALREFRSGRTWTFGQLAAAADNLPKSPDALAVGQGNRPEFVLEVLRAWRDGVVFCPLEAGQSRPVLPLPPSPTVHLKFTSATTGPSRAIAFTAEQLAADARNICVTMGLRPEWPNLGVISLAHSYGFSNLVLPLLLHGIPLVILDVPLPEAVRAASQDMASLTLAAVPVLWRTWHDADAISSQVRLGISAGAPLACSLEQEIYSKSGIKVHNFYGSSECGGIAYDRTLLPRRDDSCVGSPMDNVTVALDESGCLEVISDAAGMGYWPNSDVSLGNGRFRTSDICLLQDGLLFLRGRLGDQINVAGRKIAPAQIEQVLALHPAVRDCVVLGLPGMDANRNDVVAAAVVPSQEVTVGDLKDFLLARLPAWQVPREWRLVDSLSESSRGKVSRAEWRKRFQAGL